MKILITGATGFLGRHAAERLNSLGFKVRGMGRNPGIGALLEKQGIEFCKGHLEDPNFVVEACAAMDFVLHCGALSAPWGRAADFYQANVLGTRHVISGCLKHGIKRLVHISTPSLYFDYRDRLNISESALLPLRPCNHYAATKRLAEQEIDQAAGLDVITLRPRGIFGPGDQTILPRIIEANRQRRLPLFGQGKALIDMTYVGNVVDAMLLCIKASKQASRKKYNITNGEPWAIGDLLMALFQKIGEPFLPNLVPYPLAYGLAWMMETFFQKEPPFTRYTLSLLAKSQTLNIQAARDELGYCPRINMEEGIALFANWYKP